MIVKTFPKVRCELYWLAADAELQRCIDAVIVGGEGGGGSEGHTLTSPLMGGHGRCSRDVIETLDTALHRMKITSSTLGISADLICEHVRY